MIVLAIAGLILSIVFIAVPALQRNARNTSRRADVAAIRGAIETYAGNNNGSIPTSKAQLDAALSGIDLGFYRGGTDETIGTWLTGTQLLSNNPGIFIDEVGDIVATTFRPTPDELHILWNARCDDSAAAQTINTAYTADAGTITNAGPVRGFVILYAIEEGTNSVICEDNS